MEREPIRQAVEASETLAATDEVSPRPLAMAEEEKKQEWGEAGGEGLRGTIPLALLSL